MIVDEHGQPLPILLDELRELVFGPTELEEAYRAMRSPSPHPCAVRCARCEGYDLPALAHAIGCPNDPDVTPVSHIDPFTLEARRSQEPSQN